MNNLIETYIINGITIIKYPNKIMEQFGFVRYNENGYVKFPVSFSSKVCPMVHMSPHSTDPISFSIKNPDNVGFWLSFSNEPSAKNLLFRAIGYWE